MNRQSTTTLGLILLTFFAVNIGLSFTQQSVEAAKINLNMADDEQRDTKGFVDTVKEKAASAKDFVAEKAVDAKGAIADVFSKDDPEKGRAEEAAQKIGQKADDLGKNAKEKAQEGADAAGQKLNEMGEKTKEGYNNALNAAAEKLDQAKKE